MKWVYQVFLGQSTLALDEVRNILSVFPSIISLDEENLDSLAGKTRNIRAYVEVADRGQMTDLEQAALRILGLEMSFHTFSPLWAPGELEALQENEQREKELRRQAYLEEHYPERRYYLCYFRQEPVRYSITVSFVHSTSYPPDQYEQAQKHAKELENQRYERKDFNLQIETRLAESEEKARAGIFLI